MTNAARSPFPTSRKPKNDLLQSIVFEDEDDWIEDVQHTAMVADMSVICLPQQTQAAAHHCDGPISRSLRHLPQQAQAAAHHCEGPISRSFRILVILVEL